MVGFDDAAIYHVCKLSPIISVNERDETHEFTKLDFSGDHTMICGHFPESRDFFFTPPWNNIIQHFCLLIFIY